MEVFTHLHIDPPQAGPSTIGISGNSAALTLPDGLANCGFPAKDCSFDCQQQAPTSGGALNGAQMLNSTIGNIASNFAARTNSVVFAFGTGNTSKRAAIVDAKTGLAAGTLSKIVAGGIPLVAIAYGLNNTENIRDLADPSNQEARLTETVREGPRVNNVTRKVLKSAGDVAEFFAAVTAGCSKFYPIGFGKDADDNSANIGLMHEAIIVSAFQYEDNNTSADSDAVEQNSLHFVVVPDSQRPALCGIDGGELKRFEFAQKCIAGAAGVVGAVLASRLRVPFGKSRLTGLFKRTYNAERGNKFNHSNKPTATYALFLLSGDEAFAEESYHTFSLLKKLYSPMGFTSSSLTLTRDMAAEKWRLEQDMVELKDELNIARQVFGYKPCIVDQTKPVANIHEEEAKRISEILKRREEARLKQQQELEQRAKADAAALIEQEERKAGSTLRELEDKVARVRQEFEAAEAENAKKRAEHDRHIEKIRKKKSEEEDLAEQLRQQVAQLEDEIAAKEVELQRRKRQIESANQDAANSRENAKKERVTVQAKRQKQQEERRALRANWLEEIRATNDRLIAQVTALEASRKKLAATDSSNPVATNSAEYETENGVREDIKSINEYLPRLIALEDVPADVEQSESIRHQLEEYFEQEKNSYTARLSEEKVRLTELEKELQELRGKAKEVQGNRRRELLAEAVKKEHHVQSIIDQVMQYLQNGVRLQKVSSNGQVRRRLFFISEDCKKIFACDLDESGAPINRRKPTMTVFISDIESITLGVYTSSFVAFAGKADIKTLRDDAMKDNGSQRPEKTPIVTPVTLGKYTYRAFTLFLKTDKKTVELVCDTDSDCEAWLLALKRLVSFKTPYERLVDQKCGRPCPPPTAVIGWGEPMVLHGRNDLEKLYPEEIKFCSENHVPPRLFIKTRDDVKELSKQMVVTVYDIRKASALDLLRSQCLLDYFVDRGIVPRIYGN